MELIDLTTAEKIKHFFDEKETKKVSKDCKVGVVKDGKLKHLKAFEGQFIRLIDGSVVIGDEDFEKSINDNLKSVNSKKSKKK